MSFNECFLPCLESPLTAMAVTPNSEVTLKALVNYGGHLDYRSADGLTAIHKAAIYGQCENIKVSTNCQYSTFCANQVVSVYSFVLQPVYMIWDHFL